MEAEKIREYAGLMTELGLTAMEITENGATLRMEKGTAAPAAVAVAAPAPAAAPAATPAEALSDDVVTSPMVGVFYAAPAEGAKPYVAVGDKVRKGDVLCIIEAMKLMNEITADFGGVVEAVCVENRQVVEYGMPLFRIRKG